MPGPISFQSAAMATCLLGWCWWRTAGAQRSAGLGRTETAGPGRPARLCAGSGQCPPVHMMWTNPGDLGARHQMSSQTASHGASAGWHAQVPSWHLLRSTGRYAMCTRSDRRGTRAHHRLKPCGWAVCTRVNVADALGGDAVCQGKQRSGCA